MSSLYNSAQRLFIFYFLPFFIFAYTGSHFCMQYNWEQPFVKTVSLIGHKAEIIDIKISPDESFIVTTDASGVAKIWDPKFGICLHTLDTSNNLPITCITISDDNAMIALAHEDGTTTIWNTQTYQSIQTIPCTKRILDMQFSSMLSKEGKTISILILWSFDYILTFYDIESGKSIYSYYNIKDRDPFTADINYKTKQIAMGSRCIDLYNLPSEKHIKHFDALPYGKDISCIFSNTHNFLALYNTDIIQLWNVSLNKIILELSIKNLIKKSLQHLEFNKTDTNLILYTHDVDQEHTIVNWDIKKGKEIFRLNSNFRKFLELSPTTEYAITASEHENTAHLYTFTGASINKFNICAAHPNKRRLAISNSSKFLGCTTNQFNGMLYYFHKNYFDAKNIEKLPYSDVAFIF